MSRFADGDGLTQECDYTLRRNTHRLEKGLISRGRRDVFAVDYIEETVDHFALSYRQAGGQVTRDSELAWSRDVLDTYFGIVGNAPEVERARSRYGALEPDGRDRAAARLVPFRRDLSQGPPVSIEALQELAERRRSVRWFDGRQVPREAIDAAVLVAAQAPSACNRQPFEFRVYDDPERARQLAVAPGGAAGFTDGLPVTVAVVGTLDAFFDARDRHLIYIDGSLAAMSFMLALETLGLSSCALNTPGDEAIETRLGHELRLLPHERPIMLIAVGYPDPSGLVPRSQKKPLDQLRRYC